MAVVTADPAAGEPAIVSTLSSATMKTTRIPKTDLDVSRVAYGSAMLGNDEHDPDFIAETIRAMNVARENGVNFFDRADIYGAGESEIALGNWLKQSPGLRSREHIVAAAEGSLSRLDIDHLDILLPHSPDPLVEPEEVARAFDELHRSGKVRWFGVSNFAVIQIELLKKYVRQPLVANQIPLGLGHYAPIATVEPSSGFGGLVDYGRLHEIQVQAYSPLRSGTDRQNGPSLLNPPPDAPAAVKQAAQLLAELARQNSRLPQPSCSAGCCGILPASSPSSVPASQSTSLRTARRTA